MRLVTPLVLLFLAALLTPAYAQADKTGTKVELETPEAVLEAHLEATGGADAWAAVQSRRETGERILDGVMGQKMTSRFVTTTRYPGYLHQTQEVDMPNGTMVSTVVQTPEAAWVNAPNGRHDLPVDSRPPIADAKPELRLLTDPAASLTLEVGTYADTPVYIVTVTREGTEVRRWYDRESLLLVAAETASADGIALTEASNYRACWYRFRRWQKSLSASSRGARTVSRRSRKSPPR